MRAHETAEVIFRPFLILPNSMHRHCVREHAVVSRNNKELGRDLLEAFADRDAPGPTSVTLATRATTLGISHTSPVPRGPAAVASERS